MLQKQSKIDRAYAKGLDAVERADFGPAIALGVYAVVFWAILGGVQPSPPSEPAKGAPSVAVVSEGELAWPNDSASADSIVRKGDPARAVWTYLCNREPAIGATVGEKCPALAAGEADHLMILGPLQRDEENAVFGRRYAERDSNTIETPEEGQ